MRRLTIALAVMLVCHAAFASPAEALAVSLADCRTLPKEDSLRIRYLDMTQWHPKERLARVGVVNFWLNSLSRRRPIGRPVLLGTDAQVLRIDLADYSLDPKVWERLGVFEAQESYFHRPKTEITADKKYTKNIAEQATWLPAADVAELTTRTQSWIPLVRADWFVWTTSQQADRGQKGKQFGFYDFLQVGDKQDDFLKLVGADPKRAKELQLVISARVGRSGVALNNRGIARMQTLTGGLYFTQDFKTSTDKQNALRLLRDEAQPPQGDATEIYGVLPNGLFTYFLANAKGERQDTAPDFIASDQKGLNNDSRVHAARSCVSCHKTGLQPINDFVRSTFRGPAQLRSIDKGIFLELEQLYLNDLASQQFRDNLVFRDALKVVNGLTPEDNAAQFRELLREYIEEDVSIERAAFELGVTEIRLREVLGKYTTDSRTRTALADPLLIGWASTPSQGLRREHFAELVATLYDMAGGVIP